VSPTSGDPFTIEAIVLLPDHLHCIWTLPDGNSDYATRWRLLKSDVPRRGTAQLQVQANRSESRLKRGERYLWQRCFWEHQIQDEADFTRHCDDIHYNPVRHRLCQKAVEWQYSSFYRYVTQGIYSTDWGMEGKGIAVLAGWGEAEEGIE
jgi:putative transposase